MFTTGNPVVTPEHVPELAKALRRMTPTGRHIRGKGSWTKRTGRLLALFIGSLISLSAAAQTKPVRRILILNEVGPTFPVINLINGGLRSGLNNSPYKLEFYYEYLEALFFPDPASQKQFREFIVHKYQKHMPDVIITVGPAPLKFMVESHKRFFPGIPVVFCLPNGLVPGSPFLDSDFTGVETDFAAHETLEAALRLLPDTEHVTVIGGVADYDRQRELIVQSQIQPQAKHLDISYLTNIAMPALLEQLRHLPTHTIVLLTAIGQDATGTRFTSDETGQMISAAANAPVFSLSDLYLNHGEVGGDVADMRHQGRIVAAMTLRILQGEKPADIPHVRGITTYIFDWNAMQRWRLKESDLPAGSVVLNRQPSVWEEYWRYIIAAFLLLAAQGFVIAGLLWQRAKRKRAEVDLLDANVQLRKSEEKFSKAFHRSPLAITLTTAQDSRYLDVNETFEQTTGWSREEIIGQTPFELGIWLDTSQGIDLQHHVWSDGGVQNLEFSFRTRAGEIRTGLGSMELIEIGGERCVLSVATDITERKQANEKIQGALREGEERFRLVANTAPVMIWMSGPDKRCTYFNQPWLDFRGRTLKSELSGDWVHDIHPEDKQRCLDADAQAFEQRKPVTIEYRLRRHDGEYRWVFDSRVPRCNADGSFAGFIGSIVDVTDLKRAEKALASLSGRLIEAQEQERRHVARELHDDISQKLALLTVELQRLVAIPSEAEARLRDGLKTILNGTAEVASDLHSLSHRLHTSKLEILGLVATMRCFCREVSEQRKVEVDLTCRDVPDDLPEQISLCLFRVLQEGLNNAVKHSGVRKFEVRLERVSDKLQLMIRDQGAGFDPGMEMFTTGLGLMSMRERVSLVKGALAIESKPRSGTEIKISVPIPAYTELRRSSTSD
jgi:PAS domain S-box-containing protein